MGRHLVVDIGNTSIRFAQFENGEIRETGMLIHGADTTNDRQIVHRLADSSSIITGASVAPSLCRDFEALLPPGSMVTWLSGKMIPLENKTVEPYNTGIDRLLNCLAAYEPGKGAVVVDVGSAITWDVVSPLGAFLGGAIAPGPGLSFEGLNRYTEKLPRLAVPDSLPKQVLGRDTTEAIRSGVMFGALASIMQITQALCDELPFTPSRHLTGGYGALFADKLTQQGFTFDPLLTLRGIHGVPHADENT